MQCEICKGSKHILKDGKIVRCQCLIKQRIQQELDKYDLGQEVFSVLSLSNGRIEFLDSEQFKLVKLLEQKIQQNKQLNHSIIIDLQRSTKYYSILAATLILRLKDKVSIFNLQSITDDLFQNKQMNLNKINIVVDLGSINKNLSVKLIQNICLRSKIEGKITLFVFSDYMFFKQENPEIINILRNPMVLPDATYR